MAGYRISKAHFAGALAVAITILFSVPAFAFPDDDIFPRRSGVGDDGRQHRSRDVRQQPMRPFPRTRTVIVPFKNSPFPYRGMVPGAGKPFLDVEEKGRRGHTTASGTVYWEDSAYSNRNVLLQIPSGFDPNRPAAMIFFFHGNFGKIDRDVRDRQLVPRQVAASGINAVLVAPQLAVNAQDSSAGRFWEPGAFNQFADEAADQLAKIYGTEAARAMFRSLPVIFVAYSGGYMPAAYAASLGGVSKRLLGVVLFDALYGEHERFAEFIATKRDGFFISAYGPSTKEGNAAMQSILAARRVFYRKDVPDAIRPGTVTFVAAADDVEHNDFVTEAWVKMPLQSLLSRIPSLSRKQAPRLPAMSDARPPRDERPRRSRTTNMFGE